MAAEEELRPALADHWQDVTTSLHSDDAHHLYLPPDEVERGARAAARPCRFSAVSADQPHQFRAQAADTAARTIHEAEPELEKLVRSGYVAVVAWDRARRGRARRLQPRPPAAAVRRRRHGATVGEGALVRAARACARASSRRS